MLPFESPGVYVEVEPSLGPSYFNKSNCGSLPKPSPFPILPLSEWVPSIVIVLTLSSVLLSKLLPFGWIGRNALNAQKLEDPPQLPYTIPFIGNAVSYMIDASRLASSIVQRYGASGIVRLNMFTKDVYIVSGAEYLNAIWKDTQGLSVTYGVNLSLQHMFNAPKHDMKFFRADISGTAHEPHPQSSIRPENRVHSLMYKATVDCLTGPLLTITGERFQTALIGRMETLPIHDVWVEMDDLFGFLHALISCTAIQMMCGVSFLERFPDFFDDFWQFDGRISILKDGWPRWMMPKAWQARDRCLSAMKQWRKLSNEENFDGNEFYWRKWSYYSKMQGISEDGVASSDLGFLWALKSNSNPATSWLFFHMLRDRSLLTRATLEVNACCTTETSGILGFDMTKLCNQPLLQSCYAEALRLYISVYIIRKPQFKDAQILGYKIPVDKMIAISSTMAHMDKRNWNLGSREEHPVDTFWAERFLTYSSSTVVSASASSSSAETRSTPNGSDNILSPSEISSSSLPEPKFSLNGYRGAWVPYGGGVSQCPGRHWVKLQMLLTFAVINSTFDIELLAGEKDLKVDMKRSGLGTLHPVGKAPFRIRRKKIAV